MTVICNQAASFKPCLFKVQQGLKDQLKAIGSESRGNTALKVSTATDKLNYLMDFNSIITLAVTETMEHLTDFVFVSIGNLMLAIRNSSLSHLKAGVKPDTLAALRTTTLQLATLLLVNISRHTEENIAKYEDRERSSCGKGWYHPYEQPDRRPEKGSDRPA